MSHELDKFGMPVGWALIAMANVLGWISDHGMTLVGGVAAIVGMGCQVYTTWLRHQDYTDRRRRRAAGE